MTGRSYDAGGWEVGGVAMHPYTERRPFSPKSVGKVGNSGPQCSIPQDSAIRHGTCPSTTIG